MAYPELGLSINIFSKEILESKVVGKPVAAYEPYLLDVWLLYAIMVRFFTARQTPRNNRFARYLLMSFYGKF